MWKAPAENGAVMKETADKAATEVDKAEMEVIKLPPWSPMRYLRSKLLRGPLSRKL